MNNLLSLFFVFYTIPNSYCQSYGDHYNKGNTYMDQGNYQQAIIEFTKSIDENPNFEPAYLNRISAKIELKDYRGAIIDCNKVIKLNGRSDDAYWYRGIAKGKFGDHIGAIVDYCTTIDINHKYPRAYYNRGLEKIFLKQLDGGCADLKKAAELRLEEAKDAIKEHCK